MKNLKTFEEYAGGARQAFRDQGVPVEGGFAGGYSEPPRKIIIEWEEEISSFKKWLEKIFGKLEVVSYQKNHILFDSKEGRLILSSDSKEPHNTLKRGILTPPPEYAEKLGSKIYYFIS